MSMDQMFKLVSDKKKRNAWENTCSRLHAMLFNRFYSTSDLQESNQRWSSHETTSVPGRAQVLSPGEI